MMVSVEAVVLIKWLAGGERPNCDGSPDADMNGFCVPSLSNTFPITHPVVFGTKSIFD